MALTIQRIELERFRSWDQLVVEPSDGLTVIVGPNAAGKTNVVEAVQLLTTARSFRNPRWSDVVTDGATDGRVSMVASDGARLRDVAMAFTAEGKRTITVNGSKRRGTNDVLGALPSVLFTPDDLGIVKDSAQRRREELDGLGEQLSAAYRDIRSQYERALRQRNSLLKLDDVDEGLLGAWTERLIDLGSALVLHRVRLFDRLKGPMEETYAGVSAGEKLSADYECVWWNVDTSASREDVKEDLRRALEMRNADERARRVTLVGPHRDDVSFAIDGKDARSHGSQGQQRTAALAWKLSEVTAILEITGSRPVLLLDDVMSELDATRRVALSGAVAGSAQTIVTTTNLAYFEDDILENAAVVSIGV